MPFGGSSEAPWLVAESGTRDARGYLGVYLSFGLLYPTIMQSPYLPWEVIERVIGHSRGEPTSLRAFSLTCRELLPRSRCVMLAAGVRLKNRDHAFALADFLQDNPHLKRLIRSIIVRPDDLPPFPLLRILSDLSEITFSTPNPIVNARSASTRPIIPAFHPSNFTGFRLLGSHIRTLHLVRVTFATPLAFAQLLLAFTSIFHLVCKDASFKIGGDEAPLAVAKQRLSEKLRLRSLVVSILAWQTFMPNHSLTRDRLTDRRQSTLKARTPWLMCSSI